MSWFEIIGSIFGFISIWLTVRASVWCWPTGIVNIVLLLVTYTEARLYGDVVNYLVMLALSIWGWIAWVRPTAANAKRRIRYASARVRWLSAVGVVGGTPLMALLFIRYTDAAQPWWDSLVNALALVAQVLLALMLVENWVLWIVSDVVAIGVYLSQKLYVVTALYISYTVFACWGLREWIVKARA